MLSVKEVAVQGNIIAICLVQLVDQFYLLRQWLALCLAKVKLWSHLRRHHHHHCIIMVVVNSYILAMTCIKYFMNFRCDDCISCFNSGRSGEVSRVGHGPSLVPSKK